MPCHNMVMTLTRMRGIINVNLRGAIDTSRGPLEVNTALDAAETLTARTFIEYNENVAYE